MKSCYDWIVHAAAILCMRRLGVSKKACQVMFGTIQQMEHYISTAYGQSETAYTAIQFPLQGVLQGNGAGQAIWLVTSIPLINMLRWQGLGFRSTNSISKESYRIVCYTFVDDTDTIHCPIQPTGTSSDLFREMQEVLNNWEGGLSATGGALVPTKCFWYALDFKWNTKDLTWDYKTIRENPGNIQIKNSDGNYQILKRLETHESRETLGLWNAPDGNQNLQIAALEEKIAKWTAKIKTRQLTSTESWISLRGGIGKSISYPLAATSLTKQDCHRITKPLLDVALPALGVSRTYPHKCWDLECPPSGLSKDTPRWKQH